MLKWQRNACLRCNLLILFWFRHRGRSTDSWMYNIAPSLPIDLFTKRSPKDSFRGFVHGTSQSAPNRFDTGQVWANLPFLIRISHSIKKRVIFKGSLWKLIHLLETLGVMFEHPPTAHSTILELMLSSLKLARFGRDTQWRHTRHPSPQCGFQTGGRSNCSGTELFAVTVKLKGKFNS